MVILFKVTMKFISSSLLYFFVIFPSYSQHLRFTL
nr:MAG TPA: hypothetical protein [Caudoviricetes sp.]